MSEKNYLYFQYDEIGKPLFFIEFKSNSYFTLFETSFFSDKTELFFERSVNYARISVIEDYPFDEAHFFELLELDCQRYVEYENPINHDFIAPHFIQSIDPRFDFLKAEIFIMKKLQRGGTIRNIKYASEIVANCLNLFGGDKFSHHFSKLTPIKKGHFLFHVLNSETENSTILKSEFKTNNCFVCTIGVYDIYCYEDEKGVFSCWLKEEKGF